MSQMQLNLCTRNQDPLVKYQKFNPIQIDNEKITLSNNVNNVNFHIPMLLEEVKRTPKKVLKEYQKKIKIFLATIPASLTILPLRSMASTLPNTATTVTSNLPNAAEGIPPELTQLLFQLVVIIVGVGVIASIILLVISGMGRMFRMKGMTAWTTDILKGLAQILTAPVVVFLVYYLANLIFSGSGWWVTPFAMH